MFIDSTGGNYRLASWSGISGEPFYGFASAADGDELIYNRYHYPKPGDFWHLSGIRIENRDKVKAVLLIPKLVEISKPHTTHVILEITDNGVQALT